MEESEEIQRIKHFLNEVVIGELNQVIRSGAVYMPFVLMGQAIEVLGGLLDQKPAKATGMAEKRFSAAVRVLFGGRYRVLNDGDFLYRKLRNQMVHSFISSRDLWLVNQEVEPEGLRHMEWAGQPSRLVLVSGVFYRDICKACQRLVGLMKEGKVKPKRIAYGDDE